MPRLLPTYPRPGESAVADTIRARRAVSGRDLTVLDGSLLHAPELASGYNALLAAVRTKNSLPAQLRELMILRVAVRNSAAYEWIHHEHVGLEAGLTIPQLATIRDTSLAPTLQQPYALTPLQVAALQFTDASTVNAYVPAHIFDQLKSELSKDLPAGVAAEQRMTEAVVTVSTYNLVSRFLLAVDVDDKANKSVPFPASKTTEHKVDVYGCSLHVKTHVAGEDKPWVVLVNSLLTNLQMWDGVVARLSPNFNLLTYDQRGHGQSTVPAEDFTMDQLADDIVDMLSALNISTPIHAVVGVSQGGATALAFATRHADKLKHLVACDTQIKSPASSKAAWEGRIDLAQRSGMPELAEATVKRWFPPPSIFVDGSKSHLVREMISSTPLDGFIKGSKALMSYDYTSLAEKVKGKKVLLMAGERDGVLPQGLAKLAEEFKTNGAQADFYPVAGCGHLPMLDGLKEFVDELEAFLRT